MYLAAALLLIGVGLVILLALINLKWTTPKRDMAPPPRAAPAAPVAPAAPAPVLEYQLNRRESIDQHLDELTKKLAEKELSINLSRSRLQRTQQQQQQQQQLRSADAAVDDDARRRYQDVMDALRSELKNNEEDCKRLQGRIEWVAKRRAEVEHEIGRSQQLYAHATSHLLSSLAELQRERRAQRAPAPPQPSTRRRLPDAPRPVPDVSW